MQYEYIQLTYILLVSYKTYWLKNIALLQPISTVNGATDGDFDDQRLSYETTLTFTLIFYWLLMYEIVNNIIFLENILSNKNIAILQPISTIDGPTDGDFDDQRLGEILQRLADDAELHKLLSDEKMRCEIHRSNYEKIKAEYLR